MRGTLDGVIASLRELERCVTVSEFVDRSIDVLWDLIPCSDLSFNELDEAQRRVELYRCRSESANEDESDEGFWSYMDDLPICWGLPPGAAGVTRTQDVISRRVLRTTQIYAEVLRPNGIEYEMKMSFESPPWVSRAFLWPPSIGASGRAPC